MKKRKEKSLETSKTTDLAKEDRPEILGGLTIKVLTGCGNMYCQLNWRHGRLFEIFATLGKSGGCASCETEAVTRLITLALRRRTPIDECIDEIRGLRCPNPIMFPKNKAAMSCPDAIANTMIHFGKMSIIEMVNLILQVNDLPPINGSMLTPVVRGEDDDEAKQALKRIEELKEKRKEDDLYGEEEDEKAPEESS